MLRLVHGVARCQFRVVANVCTIVLTIVVIIVFTDDRAHTLY